MAHQTSRPATGHETQSALLSMVRMLSQLIDNLLASGPPAMTTAQRNAIAAPIAGQVIYNTTTGRLNVRTATAWRALLDEPG